MPNVLWSTREEGKMLKWVVENGSQGMLAQ